MIKTIHFQTEDFLPQLSLANSIIAPKNSLPILGDIHIETRADGFGGVQAVLTASDSETWVELTAPLIGDSESDVVFCVEAAAFINALRNLKDQPVTLKVDTEKMLLVCEYSNGKFQMAYDNPEEFPSATMVFPSEGAVTKYIDNTKMLTALRSVSFAVGNDELRPVLSGVHVDFVDDGMVAVATDGQKLAKYKDKTITLKEGETPACFTLPKKPCKVLANILGSTIVGDVTVSFNDRCVAVNNSKFMLVARLIAARYPNYDSVIPQTHEHCAVVEKNSFANALNRVIPMGNSTSELVELRFDYNTVSVKAEDFDFSRSACENVACDWKNEPFRIGFKGSSVLQSLNSISTDNVKLLMNDPTRAIVLCEETENTQYAYLALVMPVLINN